MTTTRTLTPAEVTYLRSLLDNGSHAARRPTSTKHGIPCVTVTDETLARLIGARLVSHSLYVFPSGDSFYVYHVTEAGRALLAK